MAHSPNISVDKSLKTYEVSHLLYASSTALTNVECAEIAGDAKAKSSTYHKGKQECEYTIIQAERREYINNSRSTEYTWHE